MSTVISPVGQRGKRSQKVRRHLNTLLKNAEKNYDLALRGEKILAILKKKKIKIGVQGEFMCNVPEDRILRLYIKSLSDFIAHMRILKPLWDLPWCREGRIPPSIIKELTKLENEYRNMFYWKLEIPETYLEQYPNLLR